MLLPNAGKAVMVLKLGFWKFEPFAAKFSKSDSREPPVIVAGIWDALKNVGSGAMPASNALSVFKRAWMGSWVARVPRYLNSTLVLLATSCCTLSVQVNTLGS